MKKSTLFKHKTNSEQEEQDSSDTSNDILDENMTTKAGDRSTNTKKRSVAEKNKLGHRSNKHVKHWRRIFKVCFIEFHQKNLHYFFCLNNRGTKRMTIKIHQMKNKINQSMNYQMKNLKQLLVLHLWLMINLVSLWAKIIRIIMKKILNLSKNLMKVFLFRFISKNNILFP